MIQKEVANLGCASTALSVSVFVSVNHMNDLYPYLYSDCAGPSPEVGGI